MTDVWRLPLQATRKMVLLALADNANDEGSDCWPSIGKLVEKCSMSERAVQGHLAALEEVDFTRLDRQLIMSKTEWRKRYEGNEISGRI